LRPKAGSAGFRHQLGLIARVNAYAVPPSTLLIFILSSGRTLRSLSHIFTVTLVVANCNFLLLNTYYQLVWRRMRTHDARAYLALCATAPVLGACAALMARSLLGLLAPWFEVGFWGLMALNALLAVLFGLAFFRVEDLRQQQSSTLAQLEASEAIQRTLKGARDRAQLAALQTLIKPHFVFNSLNAVVALIGEDPKKAEETTLRLAHLMRYLLEVSDDDMMSLESELGVVQAYLEIEKVRLGNRLTYAIDSPAELRAVSVPGLLLQPLVENAVNHGVRQRPNGGFVRVRVSAESDSCRIEIVDNGPGFSDHHGTGRAMGLVRSRLDGMYADNHELRVERDEAAGETIVMLRLPLALRTAPERAERGVPITFWPASAPRSRA
jgi:signal transduction histidine kinase